MTTEKLAFYLRAALAWIDAVPKEVADRLPAMPGFDRDEADEALVGMPSGKMAPVQGYPRGIPWEMHLQAYDVYCKRYRPQRALIEGGCRGGFGTGELDDFIPGWREKLTERTALVNQIKELQEALADTKQRLAAKPQSVTVQFVEFDDGSKAYVDSWTGGAHELGHFGGITLRFVAADGTQTVRGYQALDTLKLGQLMVGGVEKTAEAAGIAHRLSSLLEDAKAAGLNIRAAQKTPAAQWREKGEPDPRAGHYDGERAALTLGKLTDDELANGVFMNADQPLNVARVLARDPEYHPPIVWLTAAKERIRWLSRSLVKADVNAARFKALRDLCGFVENGTDGVVTIFQDDATREWVVKVDKKGYYGPTMPHALDAAIAGEGDKTNG